MYVLQRGAVSGHLIFLAAGFTALAGGAQPEVPWTWAVYSALGVAAALSEWRRAGVGLEGLQLTDPAVLTARFATRLSEALEDGCEVTVDGPLQVRARTADGRQSRSHLTHLLREARRAPRRAEDAIDRYVKSVLDALEQEGQPPRAQSVVPIIRPRTLLDDCEDLGVEPPLHRPLAGDLIVIYAFDRPRTIRPMHGEDLAALEVAPDALHGLSLENLRRLAPPGPVDRSDDGAINLWSAGGNYESSLLLLPEIWEAEIEGMQGDLIACVPARSTLITGDSSSPRTLEVMRHLWKEASDAGEHALAPTVLRWADGQWVEMGGRDEEG